MRLKLSLLVTLVAATVALYWPCGSHDFIILDDQLYVTQNPAIQHGLTADAVRWAFSLVSTETSGNWHPLTWISHALDVGLFGMDPAGHHLVNVAIHAANAALLFLALGAMTGNPWASAAVAAIFAVHPLHVESVAWVAERKDVLSTFFFMLTLLLYAGYVKKPGAARYLAVAAAFVAGLMAKSMLVTLPFVLLLLDIWPLRRLAPAGEGTAPGVAPRTLPGLLVEKVPFLAISLGFSALAMYSQRRGGYVPSLEAYPLFDRVSNALIAYREYLFKALWPDRLGVFYPLAAETSRAAAAVSALLLCAITAALAWRGRRQPFLVVGWLWFLGTLVPVIGLVHVGKAAMADRYMYIPLVGLAIMAAWGIPSLFPAKCRTSLAAVVAGVALIALAGTARVQISHWQDSVTLLEHTSRVVSPSYFVQGLLGNTLFERGRMEEALPHYREAVRINPAYAMAYYKIGAILLFKRDLDGAIRNFSVANSLDPSDQRTRRELERCLAIKANSGGK